MHLLTLTEPVNLGKTLGILEAGSWLMHDLNAFEIAIKARRGAVKVSLPEIPRPTPLETFCWLLARVRAASRFAQG